MVHSDPAPDPDLLALRALGEPVAGLDEDHLATCPQCRRDLEALRRVVGAARSAGRVEPLVAPPARVWDRVAADLELGSSGTAPAPAATPAPLPASPAGAQERRAAAPSRRRTAWLAAAAAVAGIAAGSGVTALLGRDGPGAGAGQEVARAQLAALDGHRGSGTAVVEESGGQRRLVVTATGLDAPDRGFREVWLLDAGSGRLVSLGVLEGERGSYPLPTGLELGDYPLVDVSAEPFDGDPAHSADSIVRGELQG